MNFDNEMRLEFLSKSNNEGFARVAVAAFVSQLDPTIEELSEIKTAVSEAVTNSIVHAYENELGIIRIHTQIKNNIVVIEVEDDGRGIKDVEQAKEPLFTTKPDLERSGMGFTIMENFMDELTVVSQEDKGTKVIMTKKIGKEDSNKKELEKALAN